MCDEKQYILDEPAYSFRPMAITVGTSYGFWMVCSLIENGLDSYVLLAFMVGIPVVMGLLALLCRMARKYRFRVDEEGIKIDVLLGKSVKMLWTDVRTAAVVQYDGTKEIVLSMREPEEVLLKKRLMRVAGKTSEEIHLGASGRMRGLVEQHLHMQLPDITL